MLDLGVNRDLMKDSDGNIDIDEISSKDIAVIGLSVRMPLAENQNEFWENIRNGTECISDYPLSRRADTEKYLRFKDIGGKEIKYKKGSYLENIDTFDPQFFRLSPREASMMDPNQRLFLKAAWEAVEDAGYCGRRIRGSKTGVYLGYNADALYDYKKIIHEVEPSALSIAVPGNLTSIIASRISYLLDLKGPAVSLDTACSSSLVAVHFACKSIQNGECDMALAGSVRVNLLPIEQDMKLGIESSDGKARAFDDGSDGTGLGEGAAVVLLKPLDKAVVDGDHIYAVIKGSAVNQDGSSIGITAPNVLAQEDVIVSAWENAGIAPETISYIEAHGTGTKLGDPIEIDGLTRAFRRYTAKKQFCAIGSIKTNLGHLDNAAGIAGLVKAILALKHRTIPKSLYFNRPNRGISFEGSPVYVSDRTVPWETENSARRCGVSAFGLSGTNCHIVLEEAPEYDYSNIEHESIDKPYILALSAKTVGALSELASNYRKAMEDIHCPIAGARARNLPDICHTAATGREHYNCRLAIIAYDVNELKEKLAKLDEKTIPNNLKEEGVYLGEHRIVSTGEESVPFGVTEEQLRGLNAESLKMMNQLGAGKNNRLKSLDSQSLDSLCSLYIRGADVNWEKLFARDEPKKVSLPTYPFERKRCWIDIPEKETSQATIAFNERIPAPDQKINAQPNVLLKGRAAGEYSDTERKVGSVWGQILGYDELNIFDDFGQLGGDSILAMKVANGIDNLLGVSPKVNELLQRGTIEGFSGYIDQILFSPAGSEAQTMPIEPADPREYYPVTSAQKRLFVLHGFEGIGTSYNISDGMMIEGALDKERFESAIRELVKRHEMFRTSFEVIDGEVVQKIHHDAQVNVCYLEAEEHEVKSIIESLIQPFDLSKAPILRIGLIRIAKDKQVLVFDTHHIIADGISTVILNREFAGLYQGETLPDLEIQFKDYAVWYHQLAQSDLMLKQQRHWLDVFKDEIPVLSLPADYSRPLIQSFEGDRVLFRADHELKSGLKSICLQTGATLYMVLLAAYNILLSKYSGQEDIIVGAPISARTDKKLENIIGMFVNTLAMRNYPKGEGTFTEFLGEVRENSLKAYENQDYSFDELVSRVKVKRDMSHNPLFDTMLTLQNIGSLKVELGNLSFESLEFSKNISKFDLNFNVRENEDHIHFDLEFCTRIFKRETIERMAGHFLNLLNIIAGNPAIRLSEIVILSGDEKEKILYGFNRTVARERESYPADKTVPALFEAQVDQAPDSIALEISERNLTYAELNQRANQLARILRENGVKCGSVVGIMAVRSLELIVGIMAILKAGGAYLPIDPEYPVERIKYMLDDSHTSVLLTQRQLTGKVDFEGLVVEMDDSGNYAGDGTNVIHINKSGDPAYVIYTSGSTGRPKGVMIEHRSLCNFLYSIYREFGGRIGKNDNCLSLTNISFDVSVCEIFLPLTFGAKLVLADMPKLHDIERLVRTLIDKTITFVYIPPMLLTDVYDSIAASREKTSIDKMLVGVEAIKDLALEDYLGINPSMQIINGYGPTEDTICATFYKYYSRNPEGRNVPIGKPLANTSIFILDKYMKPVPLGVTGELYISGDGLARGYLNQPEMTTEEFIPNPFVNVVETFHETSPQEGIHETSLPQRIYRTGDLARWTPDGNIEFLGRVDNQVKIRGFRVELSEIESQIIKHSAVKETVVLDRKDGSGNKYLCAYIVAEEEFEMSEMRGFLLRAIPDHMVPSYFIKLEKIPVTSNGKVDRNALPEPEAIDPGTEYLAARNDIERILVEIWQEALGIPNIGINSDFFDLGGDSIKAIQVKSRMGKYGLTVDTTNLYKYSTISELSSYVKIIGNQALQDPVQGEVKLTPVQKWFFDCNFTGMSHWNQSVMMHNAAGFDEECIKKVFGKIVAHHDALRMTYKMEAGRIVQFNREVEGALFEFEAIDLTGSADYGRLMEEKANTLQAGINLSEGPLVKIGLFKTSEGDHLLVIIHHLVTDGISWRILFEDLATGYRQALAGASIVLPEKTDSYKLWAEKLQEYADSKAALKELPYWKGLEDNAFIPLVQDHPPAGNKLRDRNIIQVNLSEAETENLKRKVNHVYNTEINDILLTALGIAIKQWAGLEKVPVSLEGHGREDVIEGINISRTVGWFTTQYPVVIDLAKSDDLSYFIRQVKELLRNIPNKGIGYGVLKYLTSKEVLEGMEFGIEPEISFNYLGEFDQEIDTEIFTISRFPTGFNLSPMSENYRKLDINCIIVAKKLVIDISFNKSQYHEGTIRSFAGMYLTGLQTVIRHCMQAEESISTASDMGNSKLTIDQLNNLEAEISDLLDDIDI